MDISHFKIKELQLNKINSKVKFAGKFQEELQKSIDSVEKFIEKELPKHFQVGSILSWKNNLKIRINDKEKNIQRIVNCVFRYDKKDERYGNTNIELASSELSKKPNLHYVGKFSITDTEGIKERILKDLIEWINEIY